MPSPVPPIIAPNLTDQAVIARLQRTKEVAAQLNVLKAARDPFFWMTEMTKTSDKQVKAAMETHGFVFDIHARRDKAQSKESVSAPAIIESSRPFPKWEYLVHYLAVLHRRRIVAPYKSRTMVISWASAAHCMHMIAERPNTEVLIQSADENRSIEFLEMIKTLHVNSHPKLRERWRVPKEPYDQPYNEFVLSNGSRAIALACGPGGPDKIRTFHPTIYVVDEAAFVPELEGCRTNALSARVLQIVMISTPNPGPFEDWYQDATHIDWPMDLLEYADTIMRENQMVPGYDLGLIKPYHEKTGKTVHSLCNGGLEMRVAPNETVFARLNYRARPDATPEFIKSFRSTYTSDALWRKEMECDASALGGQRVFPEYDPNIHEVSDEDVPMEGCIFMALDPHPRTPHAALWCLVDRNNDVYLYRELWPSKQYGRSKPLRDDEEDNIYSIREYVDVIAQLEGNQVVFIGEQSMDEYGTYRENSWGERVCLRLMDQAGKAFNASAEGQKEVSYAKRYSTLGLKFSDPKKSHQVGYDTIHDYLKLRHHETKGFWPRLHIATSLTETKMEMVNHRYRPTQLGREKELDQRAVDYRSHMIDLIRYLLASGKLYYSPNESSRRRCF
jgi:hypothetical protein